MKRGVALVAVSLAVVFTDCGRRASYYFDKGNQLMEKQQYSEAALNFRKAIQVDARFGEAHFQLGQSEFHLNHTREAFQELSLAVDLMPARDDAKVALADLSLTLFLTDSRRPQALYDKVTVLSNQLIAKDPKSYDGLRLKGYLAATDKKFKDAEECFRKANEVKPLRPEVVLSWVEVLFRDNQPGEAEKLALQLIGKDKSFGPAYDELFQHYARLGKFDDAEEILKAKARNNPADAASLLQLAGFYSSRSREPEMKAVLKQMFDNPATFPQAHLQAGDLYEGMQRWDDAIQQYEQGLKEHSKDKVLFEKRIANAWLARGKGEQAMQAVAEILKEHPADEAAQAVQASLLLTSGKAEQAAQAASLFQKLVEKNPDNATWRFNLGRALAANGDAAGAHREFEEAIKRRHDFLPPRLFLAEQSAAQGDYRSALRYADEILAIDPELPTIRLLRATSLISIGMDAEGRKELMVLQNLYPDEVELQYALSDLKQKRFEKAEGEFRKILQKNMDNIRALSGLVHAYIAQNHPEKALALLHDELNKSPDSEATRSLLADTFLSLGKLDLAIPEYERLVTGNPRSEQFRLSLGRADELKEDFSAAKNQFQQAAALAPNDPVPLALLAHAMIESGQKREAIERLRHALALKPENVAVMNDLAFLLADSGGSLDEALAIAQKAARIAPQQPEVADTLGWVYFKKSLYDSAGEIFQGLIDKYPHNPEFRYHFGMALLEKGDTASARRELEIGLSNEPSVELRRNIQAALAKAD